MGVLGQTNRASEMGTVGVTQRVEQLRTDMERELTVHVVTIYCMRGTGVRLAHLLTYYLGDTEVQDFGVGHRYVCRFPEGGVDFIVDRGVTIQLRLDCVVIILEDDAFCGGATITSRWTRPGE